MAPRLAQTPGPTLKFLAQLLRVGRYRIDCGKCSDSTPEQ